MFIRLLCNKRTQKETPNPLKIEGRGAEMPKAFFSIVEKSRNVLLEYSVGVC